MARLTPITNSRPFVAYYRVSTQMQGKSGLGLEAQRELVEKHVSAVGGQVVEEFTEIESGKSHKNRPQLQQALQVAKRKYPGCCLIVAKLDRLARNVAFVSALLETPGVEFKAADMPDANRMVLQIMAVMAEHEREQISKRTKEAIAAKMRRGNVKWGNAGIGEKNKAEAQAEAEKWRPIIAAIREAGHSSIRAICAEMNARGHRTNEGCSWHPTTVSRLVHRLTPQDTRQTQ